MTYDVCKLLIRLRGGEVYSQPHTCSCWKAKDPSSTWLPLEQAPTACSSTCSSNRCRPVLCERQVSNNAYACAASWAQVATCSGTPHEYNQHWRQAEQRLLPTLQAQSLKWRSIPTLHALPAPTCLGNMFSSNVSCVSVSAAMRVVIMWRSVTSDCSTSSACHATAMHGAEGAGHRGEETSTAMHMPTSGHNLVKKRETLAPRGTPQCCPHGCE